MSCKFCNVIRDMRYFGLSSRDIDEEGYVTLYHGTVSLPSTLKKNEIFFLTPDYEEAKNYAEMREKEYKKKGRVYKLKVKPEDVYWNQGSREVEYTKGGKIINGIITPTVRKPKSPKGNLNSYKGVNIGDILPKTKYKVLDVHQQESGQVQFLIKTSKGDYWWDAKTILEYEFPNK